MKIRGVVPPVGTPLKQDDSVDEQGLRRLNRYLLDAGVHAIFANGSMGGFAFLSDDEQVRSVATTVSEVNRRVPVIGGIGDTSTSRAVRMAKRIANVARHLVRDLLDLARILREVDIPAGSIRQSFERALRTLQAGAGAAGDRDRAFALELGAAEVAAARAAPDAAAHFDAALVAADQRSSPEAVARAAIAALAWRLRQSDRGGLDAAATVVGRLVAWDERDYRCARAVAAYYRALGDATVAAPAEAAQRRLAGERDPQLPL